MPLECLCHNVFSELVALPCWVCQQIMISNHIKLLLNGKNI
jgi:hypothetical protein